MRTTHSTAIDADCTQVVTTLYCLATERMSSIDPLSEETSLVGGAENAGMPAAMSQRIRAVRSEVINALSFLSVISSLFYEGSFSITWLLFLMTGIVILTIDCYFIHCQWMLKTNHAIPVVCRGIMSAKPVGSDEDNDDKTRSSVSALDDLLSDLPQSIWVLCYLIMFKFSLIAMVCALHSSFSLLEGLFRLQN
jgi:hypothetical protein